MATKSQQTSKTLEKCLIPDELVFVMPQRIQKQRLEDMKKSAIKKNIRISPQYCDSVTHVVTGFESLDQVIKSLSVESSEELKDKYIVNLSWFVDSIKACKPVSVEDKHRVKNNIRKEEDEDKPDTVQNSIPEWACQRSTPLIHKNTKFTEPLEILEKFAELRDQEQDYSRALAFRRASCVLKSLPYQVTDLHCLKNIKDIGGHSSRVIKDILEDGYCQEVQDILNNPWFHKMKLFTSIFGIGPSTAKKWIKDKGWSTLEDINIEEVRNDWRVTWGVAFHDELNDFVSRQEADIFCDIVRNEAEKLLPGVIVQLTGGFRRGKERGHDVDLLITHPKLGHEIGLLSSLLQVLENRGLILCGNQERSTFNSEVYQKDFKLSMRGQLDHFEKWLGICKFPKTFQEGNSELLENETSRVKACGIPDSLDDEPARKLRKITSTDQSPSKLFTSQRDWIARRVDLIISPYDQYYYALVGWTGNKHFNRDLRLYSQRVFNMKLTSHGLFNMKTSELVPASSEEEVFTNLNLKYQIPEHRNC